MVPQHEVDLRDVRLAAALVARARGVEDLLEVTVALNGGVVSSLRLTFWTTMSISSAEGFVRNVSMRAGLVVRAIVASASAARGTTASPDIRAARSPGGG